MRLAAIVSFLTLAFAAGAKAIPARGTLSGTVMRGPVAPVCVAEQPCDEPAANVTLLFSRKSRIVGRAVTDAHGRYRLRLPSGNYTVRRTRGEVEPNRARVYARRATRVDFSIDTGIR